MSVNEQDALLPGQQATSLVTSPTGAVPPPPGARHRSASWILFSSQIFFIVDVFVAGFPRTGRASCRLWRRRPMLCVKLPVSFRSLACCFYYPGAVSGDCSRQPRVRTNTARGVEPVPLAVPRHAQFFCLYFSDFSCPRTSYLIIVEEIPLLLAHIGAGHDDVRVVPYFVRPDSRRGVLVLHACAPPRTRREGRRLGSQSSLLTRPLLDFNFVFHPF